MASSSGSLKLSVGVLSVGDMGMGVAKLLLAHGYPVCTVAAGRSQRTKDRIKAASITDLASDEDLVIESDVIFSIVPPRDAIVTAKRIQEACKTAGEKRNQRKGMGVLVYVDLNAISPRTSKKISTFFTTSTEPTTPSIKRRLSRTLTSMSSSTPAGDTGPVPVRYLDGGIIGGPPALQADKTWKRPSIILSGPQPGLLPSELQSTLNMKVISDEIGAASTLKACFASFTKGLYAIATASLTTAQSAGVLPELQEHLQEYCPALFSFVDKGLPSVPPKAYRWVDEMRHIGETMSDQGHFQSGHEGQAVFEGISEIYKLMAEETVLGKEVTGKRKRGTSIEDVAEAMREGLEEKHTKKPSDEKLELAWRSSWS